MTEDICSLCLLELGPPILAMSLAEGSDSFGSFSSGSNLLTKANISVNIAHLPVNSYSKILLHRLSLHLLYASW